MGDLGSGGRVGFLGHIRRCNTYDLSGFRRFVVAGQPVGWVRHAAARRLADWPFFEVSTDAVALTDRLDGYAARSDAVAEVVVNLAASGDVPTLRSEAFPIKTGATATPLLEIDRSAVTFFGVVAYGVHLNGFVRSDDATSLWVGRRSQQLSTEPGKLDNLAAGGQPVGLGFKENMIKEAGEEAGLPRGLAGHARPVSAISYTREAAGGLKPDVLFVYDLALPPDFTPRNTDGEIDGFQLWSIERVLATVCEGFSFKVNINLVLIDFALRHGFIGPEEPDYLALCQGLRQPAL